MRVFDKPPHIPPQIFTRHCSTHFTYMASDKNYRFEKMWVTSSHLPLYLCKKPLTHSEFFLLFLTLLYPSSSAANPFPFLHFFPCLTLPYPSSSVGNPFPISAILFVFPPFFVLAYKRINKERESAAPSSVWWLGSLSEPMRRQWVKTLALYSSHSTWLYSLGWKTDCHMFL